MTIMDKSFYKYLMTNRGALASIEALGPKVKEVLNVRRYIPKEGYISPNSVELLMSGQIIEQARMADSGVDPARLSGSSANVFCMGCWQAMHGWPMYSVTTELAEAMFLTDPPGDIRWDELLWPMPAATFLIPDTEQARREFNVNAPLAITVGRVTKPVPGSQVTLENLLGKVQMPGGVIRRDMVVVTYCDPDTGMPTFHDVTAKPEWTLAHSVDPAATRKDSGLAIEEADYQRMKRCVHMGVNLLAFMSSTYEPVQVEPEWPQRKASKSHKHPKDALYAIRSLGDSYRLKRHPLGGHHASPRGHWRRGHYRAVPCGPGRTQRRTVWIEPVFVSPEEKQH